MPGTLSSKTTSYKKKIDGTIFVSPRKIPLELPEGGSIEEISRPLRASTPLGERVAIACSDACPAGTAARFMVQLLNPRDAALVREWLDYGRLRGMLQWRNGGFGAFNWSEAEPFEAEA